MESILQIRDDASQASSFEKLVQDAGKDTTGRGLVEIVRRLLAEDVPQQVAKSLLRRFAVKVTAILSPETFEELTNQVLSCFKSSTGAYDEADFILRDHLFKVHVQWGQFSDAAQALGGLNLDSAVRPYSEQEKADIYIKCAEAYLEDEAYVEAEIFVNKASPFINSVSDITIILRYRATFAKVLDSNRKFIEAAVRYHELSTTINANIDPDDLLELLAKAVTCAILGKTGPPRTRVLGLLSKDQRISSLDCIPKYSSHSIILSKMYKEQIIRKEELKVFEAILVEHQKALTADGFTILEKAIIEHNMLSTGKVYDNIRISELANILLIDERRAEKVAAVMIGEGRLKGIIDQVERLLIFEAKGSSLLKFNAEIAHICDEVQHFVDSVA